MCALAGTSAYWGPAVLVGAERYEWAGVAVWCVVAVLGVTVVTRWSHQDGWDQRHRFALAAGATLTYVWTAFPVRPDVAAPLAVDLVSNAVFGGVAVTILVFAARMAARSVAVPAPVRSDHESIPRRG